MKDLPKDFASTNVHEFGQSREPPNHLQSALVNRIVSRKRSHNKMLKKKMVFGVWIRVSPAVCIRFTVCIRVLSIRITGAGEGIRAIEELTE